jgi:hypothetical protein
MGDSCRGTPTWFFLLLLQIQDKYPSHTDRAVSRVAGTHSCSPCTSSQFSYSCLCLTCELC